MGSVLQSIDWREIYLRIYAEIEDQVNKELDLLATEKGSTKKQLVLEAIDFYLHQDRSELDQAIKDRDQARSEADQRWKDLTQYRTEANQLKRDIEAARLREDLLRSEADQVRSSKDQVSAELGALKHDAQALRDALATKDSEISFLRATVHQLAAKITPALPPSEEEIKAKQWWQFWRH